MKQAIRDVLDLDLPNMVQMDCSLLSGLLAEAVTKRTPPHLDAVFFCNSGTEAIEGALKFARAATGRKRVISLEGAFHGLSLGSLSLMGCESFTEGFGPLMDEWDTRIALDDIDSLERELAKGDVAAFVIEPVQGKGCKSPRTDFFNRAQELCRKHGTLFIVDEIQTGLGRTGKMFGFQHWNLEPDIITLAKSLSGGYVPCGAIVARREIYQKTFSRMDRCVVHSTTFGRNNLAMACGLASLEVIEKENLVENSARMGELLMQKIDALRAKHSFIKEVRGKGLIIAIEFHEPKEFKLKMAWKLLHKVDKVLFAQMVVTPDVQPASHSHAGGRTRHGRGENPAAANHRREGSRYVRERARLRFDRMPKIPGSDVGDRAELCPACLALEEEHERCSSLTSSCLTSDEHYRRHA